MKSYSEPVGIYAKEICAETALSLSIGKSKDCFGTTMSNEGLQTGGNSSPKKVGRASLVYGTRTGKIYNCDACTFQAKSPKTLRNHKKSKHEGVKYMCDQCEYVGNQSGSLNLHKKVKHEGIRYDCDECTYKCTHPSTLNTHKRSQHEGLRYHCDQCEYQSTDQGNLTRHTNAKHEQIATNMSI